MDPTISINSNSNCFYNFQSALLSSTSSTTSISGYNVKGEDRRKEKGKGKEISNNNNNNDNTTENNNELLTTRNRNRSASINTIDSTLTIRPSPHLPDELELPEEELLLEPKEEIKRNKTEQELRIENLRNKLLDCFISISLPSFSALSSSSSITSSSSQELNESNHQPIFISPPSISKLNPSFEIDPFDFLLPPSSSSTIRDEIEDWIGLREERIRVDVWVRKMAGKEEEEEKWEKLIVWDVEFDGLICLGKDVSFFLSISPLIVD